MSKNNEIFICGNLVSDFEYSHERKGVKYYSSVLATKRISDVFDEISIVLPESMKDKMNLKKCDYVSVKGEFRSNNFKHDESKKKLNLYAYVKEIEKVEENIKDENNISLTGYICKNPVYRKTPKGRDITDLILAVHRDYSVSDYIPCIAWGRNAFIAKEYEIGTKVNLCGRIQSRKYEKKFANDEVKEMVAYEVSVSSIKKIID